MERQPDKVIRIALRDFAVPSPRRGSIDAHSGYKAAAQDGIELHRLAQVKRAQADDRYEAEVGIVRRFERGGYVFSVEGRIDGIFRHRVPKIEEIKSSFNVWELSRSVEARGMDHPYVLQLLTYGYFFWKEEGALPELSLHLISMRNRETRDLDFTLDVAEYEAWLERRLEELAAEARNVEKRVARRRALARGLGFPFDRPRRGQVELIETIQAGFADRKRLLVQAPTGLGKTVGVLYPSLEESLARGQRVVYVTPKNSQHSVAEDAADRFEAAGSKIKSLTITAKSKICMKEEPLCNPTYCEYARDYYEKVSANGLLEKLAKKRKLTPQTFKKLAKEHEVCPFELQLDASPEADLLICDYNYVFAPNSALRRLPVIDFAQDGASNLVIDEAHNLPARSMDYYSPSLSTAVLERLREDARDLPKRFAREFEEHLNQCAAAIASLKPDGLSKPAKIELPLDVFADRDESLRLFLSKYLESDVEILSGDPVLRLCFYWAQFTEILQEITQAEHPEFFTTFQFEASGGAVKITCCDASRRIAECYDAFQNVVAFSATLKPFDYYAKLSGLDSEKLRTAEFQSPFDRAHRKLLIIPQVSTKYSERERNYPKIAQVIQRVSALKRGHYAVFFPSFDFMHRVLGVFQKPEGFVLEAQKRNSKASDVAEVLERLRFGLEPTLLFAVQGGVYSEGVDYPGDMLIGAFIVGPPLPSFDIEREGMREYYDEHYEEGFGYAYSYPAMAKAVQAAGRVIRSESDRGIIVLMDSRFTDPGYARSMPGDWFKDSPRELVSRGILSEISDFWERKPPEFKEAPEA